MVGPWANVSFVTSQNKALTNDAPGITFARARKAAEILRIRRHTYVIYLVGTNNRPAPAPLSHSSFHSHCQRCMVKNQWYSQLFNKYILKANSCKILATI